MEQAIQAELKERLPLSPQKTFPIRSTGERLFFGLALAIFFASGFAALLYQVIWQRMLGLFSGVDIYSVTIIVAAYMTGLGCGSLAGGHLADRLSRRSNLLVFAGCELAIALFALISKALYYDVLYLQHHNLAQSPAMLVVTLFVSLLWPTFFMGMSLPLLARALTDKISAAAGTVGTLYGVNTLGAAVGALLTTWVLMRSTSFETNLQLGAMLNLAASLCAALLAAYLWKEPQAPARKAQSEVTLPDGLPSTLAAGRSVGFSLPVWLSIYGLSGFIAMSLEMVWFRLLGIMMKSTAFTFGTMLAVYLAGLGLGAMVGVRLVKRSRQPVQVFFFLQAGVGVYACLSLILLVAALGTAPLLAPLWQYLGAYEPMMILWNGISFFDAGAQEPATRSLLLKFLALYFILPASLVGPPTFLMGMSFPYLQEVLQKDATYLGRRVGWLQTANILGCTLGAILTGLVLLAWLGTSGTLRLLLALTGIFLLLWTWAHYDGLARWLPRAGAIVMGLLVMGGLIPNGPMLWAKLHGTTPDRVLFVEDGSGLALVKKTEDNAGWVVFTNGRGESWIPYGDIHTTLGALPALLHPRPERIAVIGLASGDTLFHLAARPETRQLVSIEIVQSQLANLRQLKKALAHFPYPALNSVLNDPRIKHINADGRIYVMQQGDKYDIIEADALRPNSAYSGNLYSEQYFQLLREHLAPGGMAVTWAPTTRINNTFVKVFPYVLSFGGVILVGSNEPIAFDPEVINRRLEDPFTKKHYERSLVDVKQNVNDFISINKPTFFDPSFDRSKLHNINTDLFPKDEYMVFQKSADQ